MAKDSNKSPFQRLQNELAALLGIDPDNASFTQRLKLDCAIALRLEIDRQQAAQMAGKPVDIPRLAAATKELEGMLPADQQTGQYDLTKLTDDELRTVHRLLSKASGEDAADEESKPDPLEERIQQLTEENVALHNEVARLTEIAPPGYFQAYTAGLSDELQRERVEVARLKKALEIATRNNNGTTAEITLAAVTQPPPSKQPEPDAASAEAVEPNEPTSARALAPSNVLPINDFTPRRPHGPETYNPTDIRFRNSATRKTMSAKINEHFPVPPNLETSDRSAQLRNRPQRQRRGRQGAAQRLRRQRAGAGVGSRTRAERAGALMSIRVDLTKAKNKGAHGVRIDGSLYQAIFFDASDALNFCERHQQRRVRGGEISLRRAVSR